MIAFQDPWSLPGLDRWLDEIGRRLSYGLAVFPADSSRPPGALDALRRHHRLQPVDVPAHRDQPPAAVLADACGTAPTLDALLNPVLDQELCIVRLVDPKPSDLAAWSMFLKRFVDARADGRNGPALLVLDPPAGLDIPTEAEHRSWRTALRRGDLVIWAEEHLPPTREGLAADIAVSLAVELCGFRLDLSAALVQASLEDLADPIGWLSRRPDVPDFGSDPRCPLALLADQRKNDLKLRIWKAQLGSLFPALEAWRLETVAKHRDRLRLDEHLQSLGVSSVEEIEFGALCYQLRTFLSRPDAEQLEMYSRARNALAHRQPATHDDALKLLLG